jgi:DNA replication protein DnaC
MTNQVLDAVIREQTKQLKLPGIGRSYPQVGRQAREESWPYEEYLRELLDTELRSRHDRAAARRLREAHFPDVKTLDQIDWKVLAGVSRPKVLELAACEFIEKAEDVVIAGPVGTGKTHLGIALGVEAARRRYRVVFMRAADMVRDLLEARDARALGRLHQRLLRASLLIIDELGFVPFARTGGELLFNLLSERHERRSTLVTTNLAFSEWVDVLGDEKLTTALLDRLAHRAHILTTKGPSYRMRGHSLATNNQREK